MGWRRPFRLIWFIMHPLPFIWDWLAVLAAVLIVLGVPSVVGASVANGATQVSGVAWGVATLLGVLLLLAFIAALRLQGTVDKIEGGSGRSNLKLLFGSGPPFVENQNAVTDNGPLFQKVFRVGVKNESDRSILRVTVELEKIEPRVLHGVPLPLHWMNDNPPDQQYSHSFPLDGGHQAYVDVLIQERRSLTSHWTPWVYHAVSGVVRGLPAQREYEVTIHAHGHDSVADRMDFRLAVNDQGEITFEPVSVRGTALPQPQSVP